MLIDKSFQQPIQELLMFVSAVVLMEKLTNVPIGGM
jgi:hypothetical protein